MAVKSLLLSPFFLFRKNDCFFKIIIIIEVS